MLQKQEIGFALIDYNNMAYNYSMGIIENYVGKEISQSFFNIPDIISDLNRCLNEKTSISE